VKAVFPHDRAVGLVPELNEGGSRARPLDQRRCPIVGSAEPCRISQRPVVAGVLALCLFGPGLGRSAEPLDASIREQIQTAREAAESQQRIDATFDTTQGLLQQYRRSLDDLERLRAYNDHLARMTETQAASIRALETQLDQAQVSRVEVIPLVQRMLDVLERFVALDLPFQQGERRERIDELRNSIDSPSLSVAEKYRRVLKAYQTELEYGRGVDAYRGRHPLDGEERAVDFFRVGRIALLYRTLDGSEVGLWDGTTRSWRSLPHHYATAVEKGLGVAQKQRAPELLRIPVPAPELIR